MTDQLTYLLIYILPILGVVVALAAVMIWLAKQNAPGYGEFFESDSIDKAKKDLESWQK